MMRSAAPVKQNEHLHSKIQTIDYRMRNESRTAINSIKSFYRTNQRTRILRLESRLMIPSKSIQGSKLLLAARLPCMRGEEGPELAHATCGSKYKSEAIITAVTEDKLLMLFQHHELQMLLQHTSHG